MTSNAVKILSQDDNTAVLGGYGVVFGGMDLEGDTFTPQTDFKNYVAQPPVFFDHSLQQNVEHELGHVIKMTADEKGLWVEAQLDRHKAYVDQVLELAEKGALGWSSGSVPHLVRRDAKSIKQWPIVEFSLTPTPAEPRTIGVERIKSILGEQTAKALGIATGPEAKAAEAEPEQADDETIIQEPIMSEQEVQEQEVKTAPAVDLGPVLDAVKALGSRLEKIENQPVNEIKATAPAVLKHGRGDNEANAFKAFAMGQGGAEFEVKASNATDMNIGTAADGGNLVPTGFYNQIIARRDETSLKARLPLMNVPGIGTTVDVPIDNEADGEFIATAEGATFDLDAPAVGKKSLTLAKYTKYVDVSYELLEDTPTRLEAFLADFVGRGMAKTDNNLLITEVAANGTNFKTFAGTGAIAFGEPEDIVYNNDLSPYLEDDGAIAWVMRSSTLGDIKSIVGSDRQYSMNVDGSNRQLLGYPVYYSQKAPALATGNKTVYFGNWRYVAYREAPSLTFMRDPYTVAVSGQVRLLWHYRVVFGVLQPEAIGYGTQA